MDSVTDKIWRPLPVNRASMIGRRSGRYWSQYFDFRPSHRCGTDCSVLRWYIWEQWWVRSTEHSALRAVMNEVQWALCSTLQTGTRRGWRRGARSAAGPPGQGQVLDVLSWLWGESSSDNTLWSAAGPLPCAPRSNIHRHLQLVKTADFPLSEFLLFENTNVLCPECNWQQFSVIKIVLS